MCKYGHQGERKVRNSILNGIVTEAENILSVMVNNRDKKTYRNKNKELESDMPAKTQSCQLLWRRLDRAVVGVSYHVHVRVLLAETSGE